MGKKIHKKQVKNVSHGVKAETFAEIIDERLATKQDLKELEMRLKHDLTLRLGAMMAASIAIVAALVKLL